MPNQEDIDHQQELLSLHRRTLAQYLKQEALHGEAFVPPAVSHGITDARAEIGRIKTILRSWEIAVADHPDDAASPPGAASLSPAPPRPSAARPALWIGLGLVGALLAGLLIWQIQRPDTVASTPTTIPATTIPATTTPAPLAAPEFRLIYPFDAAAVEQIELVADAALTPTIPISGFLRLTRLEFGVFEAEGKTAWDVRLTLTNTSAQPIVLDLSRRFFKLVDDQGRQADLTYFCCDTRPGDVLAPGRQRELQLMFRSVDGWYGKETAIGLIYLEVEGLRPVVRAVWSVPALATGS